METQSTKISLSGDQNESQEAMSLLQRRSIGRSNKTKLSLLNPYVQSAIVVSLIIVGMSSFRFFMASKLEENSRSIFKSEITYSEKSRLTILNSRVLKGEKSFRVLGEIENSENFKWDRVEIVATFKDKDGPYYLATSYIKDLRPGERRSFQTLEPSSDVVENLPDNYEIKIETASARP